LAAASKREKVRIIETKFQQKYYLPTSIQKTKLQKVNKAD